MVVYKCEKCKKEFFQKSHYHYHINRKRPCILGDQKKQGKNNSPKINIFPPKSPIFSSKILGEKKIKSKNGDHKKDFLIDKNWRILGDIEKNDEDPYSNLININKELESNNIENLEKILLKECINKKKQNNHTCHFCFKVFTRNDNLKKHMKSRCNVLKQKNIDVNLFDTIEKVKYKMKQIENENQILKKKIGKLEKGTLDAHFNNLIINNNINETFIKEANIINLKLSAFGKENLTNLTEKECKKFLFKGFQAVPTLIEHIHFNKNLPENHNVYIPNFRSKYAMVFDGENWKLLDSSEIISQLCDDKRIFLENKFNEFYESLNDVTKNKFEKFLEEADTEIVKKRYKEDIKLLLYNNRNMIENTKAFGVLKS